MLSDRPGVLNSHLATETLDEAGNLKTTMLYKVRAGPVQAENYGIDLARAIGFPPGFIKMAEETSKYLRERAEAKRRNSESHRLVQRRKLVLNLHDTLVHARNSTMDDDALAGYLKNLQREFIIRLQAIENDPSDEAEGGCGSRSGCDTEQLSPLRD